MKNFLFSLVCCLVFTNGFGQSALDAVKLPKVKEQIIYLTDKYEGFRQQKNEALNQKTPNHKRLMQIEKQIQSQLKINQAAAKKIVNAHGFPSISMVGEEASHKFWQMVIAMKQDPGFQTVVLKKMDVAVKNNDASTKDFAYLSDRVMVNQGLPQYYGTQIYFDQQENKYKPHPISNPRGINERRAEMGLVSLEAHVENTNNKYERSVKKDPKKASKPGITGPWSRAWSKQ